MLSEQLLILCLGKFLSFDGLPNLMLKWIWCGSEGSYDDFYVKVVMMFHTLESNAQRGQFYAVLSEDFLPSVCTFFY